MDGAPVPNAFPAVLSLDFRMASNDPIGILLVEDNSEDVTLLKDAFSATDGRTRLHTASDGYEALHFLKRNDTSESKTLPDIALVDLNLPGKDGCEVLEAIRADPRLQCLPVIILSNSDTSADIVRCYEARANAYLTKPADPEEFVPLVKAIERFWGEQVKLPPIPQ